MRSYADRPPRMRSQTFVDVTSASTLLLGPNTKRRGLIISTPLPSTGVNGPNVSAIDNADTSSTGIKLTINPGNTLPWVLQSLAFVQFAGTGVVTDVRLHHGASTPYLAQWTTSGELRAPVYLAGGDTVTLEVSTAVGASTSSYVATWTQAQGGSRVSVSFQAPAVLDSGINLYPGTTPFKLCYDDIGAVFEEPIFAISDGVTQRLSVVEILAG